MHTSKATGTRAEALQFAGAAPCLLNSAARGFSLADQACDDLTLDSHNESRNCSSFRYCALANYILINSAVTGDRLSFSVTVLFYPVNRLALAVLQQLTALEQRSHSFVLHALVPPHVGKAKHQQLAALDVQLHELKY